MMKRVGKMLTVLVLAMLLLCACGGKVFRCAICMKQVKQNPHEVLIFGQQVEICNTCYNLLK